jgi:hypothetical protein
MPARSRAIALLCLATLVASVALAAESPLQELDEVLVIGERPGPALWKITYKDHVLWILPTLSPLPRGLTWRSSQVEAVIAESQEIYWEGSLTLNLNRGGAPVYEALRNPDGQQLRDVMPADLYARFAAFGSRFASAHPELESLRPFVATQELRRSSLRSMHLDSDGDVHDSVRRLSKRYVVPLHLLAKELVPRTSQLVDRISKTPLKADIECARWQLQQLERELREAVSRANAWSTGDLLALRLDWESRRTQKQSASCAHLLQHLVPAERAVRKARSDDYKTLRRALRRNESTLALVLLDEVFDPAGIIERFRQDGYEVVEPSGN